MAGTSEPQSHARTRNPAPGSVLSVEAGGCLEADFDFENTAPFVAGFHLEAEGLPSAEWAAGIGEAAQVMAAAYGGGTLTLRLAPPETAPAGDCDVRVRIVSEGATVGGGDIALVLRVTGGVPMPVPERAPLEQAPPPAGLVPESPPPEPPLTPQAADRAAGPAGPPKETARAVPVRPRTPKEAAPPESPPPEDLPVSTLPEPEFEEEAGPPALPPDVASILDPAEGASLPLKPGDSLYVRFSVHNDARRDRTFIIEEDRALPTDWIALVQDRVNVTHNGTGEVYARVTAPLEAEPGAYPFQLRAGPQGGILTPCNLVLQVLATPAVALTARETTAAVGPIGRGVNFQLSVASAGNADTAFRISVKAPLADAASADTAPAPGDVYETPEWRYLFDKELDDLQTSTDRAPQARTIRLQVWRKGIWWAGFRERHKVRVAAVPVTDPANGGKGGNTVELTAVRWRVLPLTGFLAVPLLLLILVMLGSGATDLAVTNGMPVGERWFVVQQKPDAPREAEGVGRMAARLTWSAPWYALLSMDTTEPAQTYRFARNGFEQALPVKPFGSERTFNVRPMFAGRGEFVNVIYVPVWTVGRLQLSAGAAPGRPLAPAPADETIGSDQVPVQGAAVTLRVPGGRYLPVTLANLSPRGGAGGRNIRLWVVKRPSSSQFDILDLKDSYELAPESTEVPFKLKALTTAPDEGQELTFLTTDARSQVLRIRLEAER